MMKLLYPTACPAALMPRAALLVEPGRPPRLMTLPPLHSVAISLPPRPPNPLNPTACPASLMLKAALSVDRPPRLMTLPPLHSVACSVEEPMPKKKSLCAQRKFHRDRVLAAAVLEQPQRTKSQWRKTSAIVPSASWTFLAKPTSALPVARLAGRPCHFSLRFPIPTSRTGSRRCATAALPRARPSRDARGVRSHQVR
jgi:hypothetical protein